MLDGLTDLQRILDQFMLDSATEAADTVAGVADEVENVTPEAAALFEDAAAEFLKVEEARNDDFDLEAALRHWGNAVEVAGRGIHEIESLAEDDYC